jgi:hypothetical protein
LDVAPSEAEHRVDTRFEFADEWDATYSGFVCSWLARSSDDSYDAYNEKLGTQALESNNMKKKDKNDFNHGFFKQTPQWDNLSAYTGVVGPNKNDDGKFITQCAWKRYLQRQTAEEFYMFEGKSYDYTFTQKKWGLKKPEEWVPKKNFVTEWYTGIVDIPGTYYSDLYAGDFEPKDKTTVSRAEEIAAMEKQVEQSNELIALYKEMAKTVDDDKLFDIKVQIEVLKTSLGYE